MLTARRLVKRGLKRKVYTLYGTSACHLCEQAEEMLQWARSQGLACDYQTVDISLSDELFDRYGLLIPVLRSDQGAELNWPFDPAQLLAFLGSF
jgi:hypothetical protein